METSDTPLFSRLIAEFALRPAPAPAPDDTAEEEAAQEGASAHPNQ